MRNLFGVFVLCVGLARPSLALAQQPAVTFDDLARTLTPGQTVLIQSPALSLTGTKVRLIDISPFDIHFALDGRDHRLTRDQVSAVGVIRHRVTYLGPLIGGSIGLGVGYVLVELTRDCGGCGWNGAPEFRAGTTTIGALVGAGIQASRGHEQWLYSKPATVTIAPALSRSGGGIAVSIRF